MYERYFGLAEAPFSIAPDPRYLYLSQRHQEALAHLLYGVNSGGGFVLLTGEVGAGKTTVCRCLLEQIPDTCDVAYVFNPQLTVGELLQTICTEFGIAIPADTKRAKTYIDAINHHLLDAHARGRHTVLIIDEAQHLSVAVLEQLRLLTNLETSQRKLLQIILLGQPELATKLARPELRQLAQRIVARYHLKPLEKNEVAAYVRHRLDVAGTQHRLFPANVIERLYRLSGGVPRVINVLCDRALLGTYVQGKERVDRATLDKAAHEVFGTEAGRARQWPYVAATAMLVTGIAAAVAVAWTSQRANVAAPAIQTAPKAAAAASTVSAATPPAAPLPAQLDWPADQPIASSEALAYAALYKAWGLDYHKGDTCVSVRNAQPGFLCVTTRGGLGDVRYHNRPAVLRMHDGNGREFSATLTALDDESATFMIGGSPHKVSVAAFTTQWDGHYSLLWHVPADMPAKLAKGARGPQVDWVATRLARLDGTAAGTPAVFDDAMAQRIKQFQLSQGLIPDGVPGPKTLLRLDGETDTSAPTLTRRAAVAPAPGTPPTVAAAR